MDRASQAAYVFDKNAQLYQDKFMYLDLYNDGFDLFCKSISNPKAHILDLGCGPGNITQYLLKQRPEFQILGIDIAPKMIELAAVNNPDAQFRLMDIRRVNQLKEYYDGMICGFCLPYLSKEETLQLIGNAASVLKSGAMFYLSTMEGDYENSGLKSSSSGEDAIFLYYHQADYLTDALAQNGFTVIDIKHQHFPTQDGSEVTDLIMIARLK